MGVSIAILAVIAVILFLAGEFLIPVDPNAPNRKLQKHFWASVLAVVGLVLSVQFSFLNRTSARLTSTTEEVRATAAEVRNVSEIFKHVVEESVQTYIGQIVASLSRELDQHVTDSLLRLALWKELQHLSDDFRRGRVPIAPESLKVTLEAVFRETRAYADSVNRRPYIVATNVGGTDTYFQPWYREVYEDLVKDSFPVIRFFVVDTVTPVRFRKGDPGVRKIDEWWREATDIHEVFGTVYTALVSPYGCSVKPRDLLLVSEYMLFETHLEEDAGAVTATTKGSEVADAGRHVESLTRCVVDDYEVVMTGAQIEPRFGPFFETTGLARPGDGEALKTQLVSWLRGLGAPGR